MKRDDFVKTIQDIRTKVNDQPELAEISDLLTNLYDGSSELFNTIENLDNNNKELVTSNEKLRKTNMELFLKIGEQTKKEDPIEEPGKEKEPEKRSYTDLFNEKGEIK